MPPTLIVPLVTVTAAGVDAPLTVGVSHAATRHVTVATSTSPTPRFLLAVMVPLLVSAADAAFGECLRRSRPPHHARSHWRRPVAARKATTSFSWRQEQRSSTVVPDGGGGAFAGARR